MNSSTPQGAPTHVGISLGIIMMTNIAAWPAFIRYWLSGNPKTVNDCNYSAWGMSNNARDTRDITKHIPAICIAEFCV